MYAAIAAASRSSAASTGSSAVMTVTATSVGARSSFAAASAPAASFSRASACGPSDAKAPRVRQVMVRRPAREVQQLLERRAVHRLGPRRPCACGACGWPPRRPSPSVLVAVLVVVLGVQRLARQLAPAALEQRDLERVRAVVVGRQQREAPVEDGALVDAERRELGGRDRRARRRAAGPTRASSPRRCPPRRASCRRPRRRGRSSSPGWRPPSRSSRRRPRGRRTARGRPRRARSSRSRRPPGPSSSWPSPGT